MSIRAGQFQDTPEKTARYVNGLRLEIQDEIGLLSSKTVEEAYHMALKAEEKLLRKQSAKTRGTFRGKGSQGGRGKPTPRDGANSSSPHNASTEEDANGRRGSYRGIGRGGRDRGRGRELRCYRCQGVGHKHYECPENVGAGPRNAVVAQVEEEVEIEEKFLPERGESLVVNKVLLKQTKEVTEPAQRKTLFRSICKVQGKCC